jgi:hypothetical protein
VLFPGLHRSHDAESECQRILEIFLGFVLKLLTEPMNGFGCNAQHWLVGEALTTEGAKRQPPAGDLRVDRIA